MRNRDIREQRRVKQLMHDPKMFEKLLGALDETGEGEEDINLGDWKLPEQPKEQES